MMPKLCFYINYAVIMDEKRNKIQPRLRDNEWIIFSYIMLMDGFSGFEKDEEFTCHFLVDAIERKVALDEVQLAQVPKSCYKDNGKLKKFIDPWHYLTRHYLIEHPVKAPLGLPLYENEPKNGVTISCRSIGKSFCFFVGDFLHEFLFSGSRTVKELYSEEKRLLFGAGSSASPQLKRTIKNVQDFYYNMPGQYDYKVGPDGKRPKPYMGPVYKRLQGSWDVGSELEHIVKDEGGTIDIVGNSIQFVALTADKHTIGAGDRFRRIYVEEFGFLKNALKVHAANKDSVRVGKSRRVGSCAYLGTSGEMQYIREPKQIFDDPDAYDMASIPNYWKKGSNKRIGLFIPVVYQDELYKDENGNTKIELSYKACLQERKRQLEKLDMDSYDKEVMFNPLEPDELLRASGNSLLPKSLAAQQRQDIIDYDIFSRKAMIGSLNYDLNERYGVRFEKDLSGTKKPILDWAYSEDKVDKRGAFIMYEEPPDYIPKNLYYVIYDPARFEGEGESLHSIIVYKHFYQGRNKTMEDAIVAEWIGRHDRIEDNYTIVIKIAKYFNATIFPEINVPGFVHWCNTNNHTEMLEGDAAFLEKEINPNGNRNRYRVGFNMDGRKKQWCIKRLSSWLTETKEIDPITGVPSIISMDRLFSPRILDEIINYNLSDNFDHISCMLGLMLLLGRLDSAELPDVDEEDPENSFKKYEKPPESTSHVLRARSRFLQY
jgi:hypothetical protein